MKSRYMTLTIGLLAVAAVALPLVALAQSGAQKKAQDTAEQAPPQDREKAEADKKAARRAQAASEAKAGAAERSKPQPAEEEEEKKRRP